MAAAAGAVNVDKQLKPVYEQIKKTISGDLAKVKAEELLNNKESLQQVIAAVKNQIKKEETQIPKLRQEAERAQLALNEHDGESNLDEHIELGKEKDKADADYELAIANSLTNEALLEYLEKHLACITAKGNKRPISQRDNCLNVFIQEYEKLAQLELKQFASSPDANPDDPRPLMRSPQKQDSDGHKTNADQYDSDNDENRSKTNNPASKADGAGASAAAAAGAAKTSGANPSPSAAADGAAARAKIDAEFASLNILAETTRGAIKLANEVVITAKSIVENHNNDSAIVNANATVSKLERDFEKASASLREIKTSDIESDLNKVKGTISNIKKDFEHIKDEAYVLAAELGSYLAKYAAEKAAKDDKLARQANDSVKQVLNNVNTAYIDAKRNAEQDKLALDRVNVKNTKEFDSAKKKTEESNRKLTEAEKLNNQVKDCKAVKETNECAITVELLSGDAARHAKEAHKAASDNIGINVKALKDVAEKVSDYASKAVSAAKRAAEFREKAVNSAHQVKFAAGLQTTNPPSSGSKPLINSGAGKAAAGAGVVASKNSKEDLRARFIRGGFGL